jgi:threonine/homoserine/homoserine lactone efflux protein
MVVFFICIGLNIAADVFKVLLAGKLRNRLTLHNLTVINKISGMLLVGFGMALLYKTVFLPNAGH